MPPYACTGTKPTATAALFDVNRESAVLIQVKSLSKSYGHKPILRDISFGIQPGSLTLVLGFNGAGKSTLLRILAGLSQPDSGKITGLPDPSRITLMTHESFTYPGLTALQNLDFWAKLQGLSPAPAELELMLTDVGLAERKNTRTADFSQGMLQRLNLARAFAHRPELALLDEALSGLDEEGSALLLNQIKLTRSQGGAVLMAGHHLEHMLALADQVLLLNPDKVACPDASASTLYPDAEASISYPGTSAPISYSDASASGSYWLGPARDYPPVAKLLMPHPQGGQS